MISSKKWCTTRSVTGRKLKKDKLKRRPEYDDFFWLDGNLFFDQQFIMSVEDPWLDKVARLDLETLLDHTCIVHHSNQRYYINLYCDVY